MDPPLARWTRQALLLSLVLGPGSVHAGGVSLNVCNKGKIALDVFLAVTVDASGSKGWQVSSHWIKPAACERVYGSSAFADGADGPPTYIGFGTVDARGQYRAGKVTQVPQLGVVKLGVIDARLKGARERPVMIRGEKQLCVRWAATEYRIEGDLERDCATIEHADGRDYGQYIPVTTALYFWPQSSACSSSAGPVSCVGGDYYLNATARTDASEVTVVPGTPEGSDLPIAETEPWPTRTESAAPPAKPAPQPSPIETASASLATKSVSQAPAPEVQIEEDKAVPGVIRRKAVGDVTPQWLGRLLRVRGTVSRVEQAPPWVKLTFDESPQGGFVVCFSGVALAGLGGKGHSGLVGHSIEVTGLVVHPRCAPEALGITPTSSGQVSIRVTE